MPRAAPTLPVNAKMYRHFAVISLVLTAGLAMFANSGNREALEDHIAENAAEQKAAPKKVASNFKDNRKGGGSFGAEAGSVSGGSAKAVYGKDDTIGPELVADSSVTMVTSETDILPEGAVNGMPPGMTPEEIRAWQARRRGTSAPATTANEPSASDIAAMMAASKARSRMGSGS
jgi:hypothetical protein